MRAIAPVYTLPIRTWPTMYAPAAQSLTPQLLNLHPAFESPVVFDTPPRELWKPESFSWKRAGLHFVSGLFAPIKTILDHPVKAALGITAGLIITSVFPVTLPLLLIAGFARGGYQIVKGLYTGVQQYQLGNITQAEKAFYNIGDGTSSIGLALLIRKRSAVATAESKATVTGLNAAEEAQRASQLSFIGSIKESLSIVSREGVFAMWKNLLDPIKAWTAVNKADLVRLFRVLPGLSGALIEPILNLFTSIPNCPGQMALRASHASETYPQCHATHPFPQFANV